MSTLFPLPLLQAISDWQRGGDANQNKRRGKKLKEACLALPKEYRTCSLCCFRQIALPKTGIWHLIGEDRLPEKISSWSLDIEVAKGLKGGVPPEGQEYQGVVLCVHPSSINIIVNLRELYRDAKFTTALEQAKSAINGYPDGAGRYGSSQSEVVLEVATATQQDIYSIGGHSSPFNLLVDEVAKLAYGPSATLEQREALLLRAEHVRSEAGPKWLSTEATQRVLETMKPHAERLGEIKREQEWRK